MGLDSATDERLARLAAGGDERAFAELYARYGRRLYAYCRSVVNNDEDANDALQNAMLKAFRALARNGGDVRVRPWLFRIAHNESISLIRARRGHDVLREDSWVSEEGPGDRALAREELDGLVDGVLELSERRRKALVMREFSGFGYTAIASALGTSAGAAKQAVFEARSALSARRSAAGLLGPLTPLWSAFSGWVGAGVPSAAKAGALVVALAAGTGTAGELLQEPTPGRAAVAQAASGAPPAIALAERAPAASVSQSVKLRARKAAVPAATAAPAPSTAAVPPLAVHAPRQRVSQTTAGPARPVSPRSRVGSETGRGQPRPDHAGGSPHENPVHREVATHQAGQHAAETRTPAHHSAAGADQGPASGPGGPGRRHR